mmetsp:Transcript_47372/g.77896  ORF Transcript_47372/g.77896 Transcript_47372/m.77896 type:complete len:106 (-) Transcript_47372:420-737(-)
MLILSTGTLDVLIDGRPQPYGHGKSCHNTSQTEYPYPLAANITIPEVASANLRYSSRRKDRVGAAVTRYTRMRALAATRMSRPAWVTALCGGVAVQTVVVRDSLG